MDYIRGSRNFFTGGGLGVQAGCPENSLDNIFVFLFYYFSKDPEGVQLFTGGGGGGGGAGGVQMLISIETHIM